MRSRGEGWPCASLTWKEFGHTLDLFISGNPYEYLAYYIYIKLRFSFSSTGKKYIFFGASFAPNNNFMTLGHHLLQDSTTGPVYFRQVVYHKATACLCSSVACTLCTVASQSSANLAHVGRWAHMLVFYVRLLRSALGDSFAPSMQSILNFLFIKQTLLFSLQQAFLAAKLGMTGVSSHALQGSVPFRTKKSRCCPDSPGGLFTVNST